MLVVCKYIVPSVRARVASEEECQGSSSPMSGAGRMLVTLTPRTVMPMAKDVLSTYLHIYRLGFSALDSPLPTLLMSHATGWLLVWSRMQMTLDRGVPPRVPTIPMQVQLLPPPPNTREHNCTCPKSWCHRNTVDTKYVADHKSVEGGHLLG